MRKPLSVVCRQGFLLVSHKKPQKKKTHKKNEVDFIINNIYNRPCVFSNVQTFIFCVVIE